MGIFKKIREYWKTTDDEPLKKQLVDFLSNPTYSLNINTEGCDEVPGAYGEFGASVNNPIPVNGITGEIVYLNRLRSKNGVGFLYHRVQSLHSPVTSFFVDHYEIVSTDASEWYDIYFCCYYPRRSTNVPSGLFLIPWDSLDNRLKISVKFPCSGSNNRVNSFPLSLPDVIRSNQILNNLIPHLADVMAMTIQEILDEHKGKWTRGKDILSSNKDIINEEKSSQYFYEMGIKSKSTDKVLALSYFNRSVELDSYNKEAYFQRGLIFYELKQYEGALSDFKDVVKEDPTNSGAHAWMGNCFIKLKDYSSAWNCYFECIKIIPKDPLYNYRCGYILTKMALYDDSIHFFNAALENNANYEDVYYERGKAFFELKKYDESLSDFIKYIELRPEDARGFFCLGRVYGQYRKYDLALEYLNKSISIAPNWSRAYRVRGLINRVLKNHEAAIEDLSKAIQANKNDIKAYLFRSSLYREAGEFVKEYKDINAVLKIDPNNESAKKRIQEL